MNKTAIATVLMIVLLSSVPNASAIIGTGGEYFMDLQQQYAYNCNNCGLANSHVVVANMDTVAHTYTVVVSGTRSADGMPLSGVKVVTLPGWSFQRVEVQIPIPNEAQFKGSYNMYAGLYESAYPNPGWQYQQIQITGPRTLVVVDRP